MDLPTTAAELTIMALVAEDLVDLRRAQGLQAQLATLKERVNALETAMQEQQQQRQRQARVTTARQQVFSAVGPLQHTLSYIGRGEWAYIAPVSRMARAAFMGAMFDTRRGLSNVCQTGVSAALTSTTQFDMALESGGGAEALAAATAWIDISMATPCWHAVLRLHELGLGGDDVLGYAPGRQNADG
jgi:TolA-binding protein